MIILKKRKKENVILVKKSKIKIPAKIYCRKKNLVTKVQDLDNIVFSNKLKEIQDGSLRLYQKCQEMGIQKN